MAEMKGDLMDDLNLIFSRKSVRHFQRGKAIDKDKLKLLVQAGMSAPSAVNIQPWEFIAVTDTRLLEALADRLPNAAMLREASAAIIVCGDPRKDERGIADKFWVQDCSAATENILLAAEALGLGAVWTGLYPNQERIADIRPLLSLPERIIPLNVIPLGYPAEKVLPKDKWDEKRLHWETW